MRRIRLEILFIALLVAVNSVIAATELSYVNGEIFGPEKKTRARWFYDLGTVLVVKSLDADLTKVLIWPKLRK